MNFLSCLALLSTVFAAPLASAAKLRCELDKFGTGKCGTYELDSEDPHYREGTGGCEGVFLTASVAKKEGRDVYYLMLLDDSKAVGKDEVNYGVALGTEFWDAFPAKFTQFIATKAPGPNYNVRCSAAN
jgi:hypothetical protein